MTGIPYFHIDAFSNVPFGGNQAAVMPLDSWLDDATLQAIGEENNFAETAFMVPCKEDVADYELRWFTPSCEVRLCGHATLAAGAVVLGLEPDRTGVRFLTRKAGVLEVIRVPTENGDEYAASLPSIQVQPARLDEAVAAMGAAPAQCWRNVDGYNLLVFDSAQDVLALTPDMDALAAMAEDQFICTAPGAGHASGADVVSRVFVPGAGVPEDSVTGSAHAVLTPYWTSRLGVESFTAFQASARGGQVSCRIDGERAWIGGPCVTVVEGLFHLAT